ncbi:dihydrodipicolinate reductase [Arenibacterium sp. CAU 1754]
MIFKTAISCAAFACALIAAPASAEFAQVTDEAQFKSIISGKTLTRPLIRLEVSPSGVIRGRGARWDVSGTWSWRDGFFCRELNWGGDDLGYNCQEVRVNQGRIRFTSDKGQGDSAEFRLRQD